MHFVYVCAPQADWGLRAHVSLQHWLAQASFRVSMLESPTELLAKVGVEGVHPYGVVLDLAVTGEWQVVLRELANFNSLPDLIRPFPAVTVVSLVTGRPALWWVNSLGQPLFSCRLVDPAQPAKGERQAKEKSFNPAGVVADLHSRDVLT